MKKQPVAEVSQIRDERSSTTTCCTWKVVFFFFQLVEAVFPPLFNLVSCDDADRQTDP